MGIYYKKLSENERFAITSLIRSIFEHNLPTVFTSDDVKRLEPIDHIRYCRMSRAIKSGAIIRIRRGFYTLNEIYRKGPINEHILANMFVPVSYISFETALWDAGWIPEFVFEIASAVDKPSFEIKTWFAVFSYTKVRQKNFYAGTYTMDYVNGSAVEAKPLKALADYVYYRNYHWNTIKPLVQSLRIDREYLETLTASDFDEIQGNYEAPNVENFLEGIRRELRI
jgi:predicted transcriptional regulator of viral defense system